MVFCVITVVILQKNWQFFLKIGNFFWKLTSFRNRQFLSKNWQFFLKVDIFSKLIIFLWKLSHSLYKKPNFLLHKYWGAHPDILTVHYLWLYVNIWEHFFRFFPKYSKKTRFKPLWRPLHYFFPPIIYLLRSILGHT